MEPALGQLDSVSDLIHELGKGGSYRFILWTSTPSWALVLTRKDGRESVIFSATSGTNHKVRLHKAATAVFSTVRRLNPESRSIPELPMYPDEKFEYLPERRAMLEAYCQERDAKTEARFKDFK